jgi:signal peptidase I
MRRRRYPWSRRIGTFVLGLLVLATLAVIALVATETMKIYAVGSSAMEPTLHCARPAAACEADSRDRVAVLTRLVSYDRGDIVTFEPSPRARMACGIGGTYLKRIVGLPGETVRIAAMEREMVVYVDGKKLEESYVDYGRGRVGTKVSVPDGHYFVLGDNRTRACDSRHFGTVPRERLVGKVVATFWPPGRIVFR